MRMSEVDSMAYQGENPCQIKGHARLFTVRECGSWVVNSSDFSRDA